jgi:hypothetical protein
MKKFKDKEPNYKTHRNLMAVSKLTQNVNFDPPTLHLTYI